MQRGNGGGGSHPEQQAGDGALCQAERRPQVSVQRRVHHAGVHGAGSHGEASVPQLLVQPGGEEQQGQLALAVGAVGRVTPAEERETTT